MRCLRSLTGTVLLCLAIAAGAQSGVKPSVQQQIEHVSKLATGGEIESLDTIYPFLTAPEPKVREAAEKAYIAVITDCWAKTNARFAAKDYEGFRKDCSKIEEILRKPEHDNAIGLEGFLLRVLNEEHHPDPEVRERLLLDLLKAHHTDRVWERDEIDWGTCITDGSQELAIKRMAVAHLPLTIKLLEDPHFKKKTVLIEALAVSKDEAVQKRLRALLRSPSAEERRAAVEAISHWEEPEKVLAGMRHDPFVAVRQHVAYAMSDRETPEAELVLLALAFDDSLGVRERAHSILARRKDDYLVWFVWQEIRRRDPVRSGQALELLVELDTPGAEKLVRQTATEKGHPARPAAIRALGNYRDESSKRIILGALDDPSPEASIAAITIASHLFFKEATPTIEKLVRSRNMRVPEAATQAMKLFGSSR